GLRHATKNPGRDARGLQFETDIGCLLSAEDVRLERQPRTDNINSGSDISRIHTENATIARAQHSHCSEINVLVLDPNDRIKGRHFPKSIINSGASEPAAMAGSESVEIGAGRSRE